MLIVATRVLQFLVGIQLPGVNYRRRIYLSCNFLLLPKTFIGFESQQTTVSFPMRVSSHRMYRLYVLMLW
jgi:hypothetical protein